MMEWAQAERVLAASGAGAALGWWFARGNLAGVTPRVVAIDLDGTLLKDDSSVSDRSVAAVQAFKAAGGVVVFASGQPAGGVRSTAGRCGGISYGICSNGATVIDGLTGDVLKEWRVEAAVLQRIIPLLKTSVPGACLFVDTDQANMTDNVDFFGHVNACFPGVGTMLRSRTTLEDSLVSALSASGNAVRMTMCVPLPVDAVDRAAAQDEIERAVRDIIESECRTFGHSIDLFNYGVGGAAGVVSLEVQPAGTHKAAALQWLCNKLSVSASEVVAFGNQANDDLMLKWAGRGVAMGNADDSTKASADEVALTNEQDGVAVLLERFSTAEGQRLIVAKL